jgi:NAD(P)-dependent dehydrogenase (short-subunit alcohol dehydrogenase family)
VATARSADAVRDACGGEHDRLHALVLDITNAEGANSVAADIIVRFGAIDVLVNNAGYAELGFFETFTDAEVRRQFEVNLFGTMNVTRAVVPHMRARRSGLIVTISSVSGLVSNGGGAVYSASKFAIEGWMEGFAQELAPLGIRSHLVEPGMLRTDFMDGKSASFGSIDIPDYAEAVAQYRAFVDEANGKQPNDPKLLATRIVTLASQGEVPSRLIFGDDAPNGLAPRSTSCGRRSPTAWCGVMIEQKTSGLWQHVERVRFHPTVKHDDNGAKRPASFRECVFHFGRDFAVVVPLNKSDCFQPPQCLDQHLLGDTADLPPQRTRAFGPFTKCFDHEQNPLFGEHRQRGASSALRKHDVASD